ncbi:hypothetical protein DFP72DRAFT_1173501 [Ephemerocybe angulata]|uniref:Uncharacterized protein n=1 Tax=Ephemerocybe angulata TaxID=980116 RepID=A0A8H6LZA5_9AGAR|nr:hypothetical protein DFP72DRAFT_1173501 [Tulosesus angulatus]
MIVADLSPNFRNLFKYTIENPPNRQDGWYGVIHTLLHIVCPPASMLVKPQKRMRLLRGTEERDYLSGIGPQPSLVDPSSTVSELTVSESSDIYSADSNGRLVQTSDHDRYPDFTIETYYGKAPTRTYKDNKPVISGQPDVIHAIIEIGNSNPDLSQQKLIHLKAKVKNQVLEYMRRASKSWVNALYGIAIVREEAWVVTWTWKGVPAPAAPGAMGPHPLRNQHTENEWDSWERIDKGKFWGVLTKIRKQGMGDDLPNNPRLLPSKFDPVALKEVPRLQQRIDGFKDKCPEQFSLYAIYGAYLPLVFDPEIYTTNPQYRIPIPTSLRGDEDEESSISAAESAIHWHTRDVDDDENGDLLYPEGLPIDGEETESGALFPEGSEPVGSISAHLQETKVTQSAQPSNASYVCPDFTVQMYSTTSEEARPVKMILEIASGGNDSERPTTKRRDEVEEQLLGYLQVVIRSGIASDILYGVAVLGTEFCYMRVKKTKTKGYLWTTGLQNLVWRSIFTPRWRQMIDSATRLSS